jgi:omega-6 fatty acid desaturase (delta-12 desaturase)
VEKLVAPGLHGYAVGRLYAGIFIPKSPLWVKSVCSVFAGLTIARMFIIYHDHQHKAILAELQIRRCLDDALGPVRAGPYEHLETFARPPSHAQFKLYTSSIGSYPIVTVEKFKSFNKRDRRSTSSFAIRSPSPSATSSCSSTACACGPS